MTYTYTPIADPLASGYTAANGVNDAGQIVGAYVVGTTVHGFLYSGGVYTTLDDPLTTSKMGTTPYAINASGQVVGTYFDATGQHGFLYSGGTYTTLNNPLGGNSGTFLRGINSSGQIVGYYSDSTGLYHGFLYSGAAYTPIDVPNSRYTTVAGINDSGQIVGSYGTLTGMYGFIYSHGTYTTIASPLTSGNFPETSLSGINNSGQIVGSYYTTSGAVSFIYSNGVFTALDNNPLSTTTYPYAINDSGQIVGEDPSGTLSSTSFSATTTAPAVIPEAWSAGAVTVQSNGNIVVTGSVGTQTIQSSITEIDFTNGALILNEHSNKDLLVYELYQAAFARTPDKAGFLYWAGIADTTAASSVQFADSFLSAPEFTQKYGANPTNTAFVTALYSNVLGRTPDQAGLQYWVGQANSGMPHDQLLIAFATSNENATLIGSHVSSGYLTTLT